MTRLALDRLRRQHASDGDRGSITLFVVVIALGLFVAVGLVVDGGGKVRALQRADDVAAEAARAGGQAIQAGVAIRGEGAEASADEAQAAARAYLSSAGVAGSVTVTGATRLTVDTSTTYTPVFLDMIGIGTQTTTGHAEVRLVRALGGEQ